MSHNELNVLDITDRLARIETKLDQVTGAKTTADEALAKANENARDIEEIRASQTRLTQALVSIVVTVVGAVVIAFLKLN